MLLPRYLATCVCAFQEPLHKVFVLFKDLLRNAVTTEVIVRDTAPQQLLDHNCPTRTEVLRRFDSALLVVADVPYMDKAAGRRRRDHRCLHARRVRACWRLGRLRARRQLSDLTRSVHGDVQLTRTEFLVEVRRIYIIVKAQAIHSALPSEGVEERLVEAILEVIGNVVYPDQALVRLHVDEPEPVLRLELEGSARPDCQWAVGPFVATEDEHPLQASTRPRVFASGKRCVVDTGERIRNALAI